MKIFLFILLFFSIAAKAQSEIKPFGDIRGTPLTLVKYTDVVGSPYLYDFWVKGKVTLKNGKKYSNDSLKYDVTDDKLIFKNDDGSLMHFADPVKEFELLNKDLSISRFVNGLPPSNGFSAETYYQVIAEGKIPLFKKTSKFITESKQYNSASATKLFNTTYSYYYLQNGNLIKISPNKKSIIALFGLKDEQLTEYIKKEKVDFKKDEDLNKLFTYFNN
ncbi:hypothetical protein [Pedobacter jamesrossensis]|uniref:DKNYY family protein n=1 Tax=Pedobacter jamesrossensis TaxID=1908238 RepID=A0ABV8NRB3_9SPHI